MPGVPNETAEQPTKLTRVEVAPGVLLKLSAADAAAYQQHQDEAAANEAAWKRTTAGDAPVAAAGEAVVPLTILTKAELVSLAESRGLATSGSKATIAARFVEPDEEEDDDGDADDDQDEGEAETA